MAAPNYDSIYDRIRSRQFLRQSETQLPDADLTTPCTDVVTELLSRYPCMGTSADLTGLDAAEVRLFETAVAAKVSALLCESAGGMELLAAQEIKQGSVSLKKGGAALSEQGVVSGFWSAYSSALRGISCVGTGGRAIFDTSGARTQPASLIDDAYGPEGE